MTMIMIMIQYKVSTLNICLVRLWQVILQAYLLL